MQPAPSEVSLPSLMKSGTWWKASDCRAQFMSSNLQLQLQQQVESVSSRGAHAKLGDAHARTTK
jgi:hypothetical protein